MARPLISCAFDGGNIVTKAVVPVGDAACQVRLSVRPDVYTNGTDKMAHAQWFYFRVSKCKGVDLALAIEDIETVCSYPDGFKGYHVACSYDRKTWFRATDTRFDSAPKRAMSFNEAGDDDDAATVGAEKGDAAFLPLARYNSDARSFRPPPPPPARASGASPAAVDFSRGALTWRGSGVRRRDAGPWALR